MDAKNKQDAELSRENPARRIEYEQNRRHFLNVAAAATATAAAALTAYPLIRSLEPSARARAAGEPVLVDPSSIEPGAQRTIEWRGRPVWVLHRTQEEIDTLADSRLQIHLRDAESNDSIQPPYAQNITRSRRPEFFVCVATCTHLGCVPLFRPSLADRLAGGYWPGGYFCPCHGSKFDLAGRVFKDVPAPTNLTVPPYRFTSMNNIYVGDD